MKTCPPPKNKKQTTLGTDVFFGELYQITKEDTNTTQILSENYVRWNTCQLI